MATSSPRAPDRKAVVVAAVVVVVLLVVYGAALVGGPEAPRVGASLEEILADPDDVVGERWALSGEVVEVLGGGVVLIGGREFGLPPVPVLLTERAREVVDEGVARGDVGQFVGRFRRLDVSELERQVRADVPEERLAPVEGGLLLVATEAAVDERSR
jgi:hypothetical protein